MLCFYHFYYTFLTCAAFNIIGLRIPVLSILGLPSWEMLTAQHHIIENTPHMKSIIFNNSKGGNNEILLRGELLSLVAIMRGRLRSFPDHSIAPVSLSLFSIDGVNWLCWSCYSPFSTTMPVFFMSTSTEDSWLSTIASCIISKVRKSRREFSSPRGTGVSLLGIRFCRDAMA